MDAYMVVRIVLIVVAIVTLVVMVQRYNSQQQRSGAEQFSDFVGYTAGGGVTGAAYVPSPAAPEGGQLLSSAASTVSSSTSSGSTGMTPPPQVATAARQQIAEDIRNVQKLQGSSSDADAASRFYDEFEQTLGAASDSCFPRDKLTAEDLLPSDAANSRWAQVNPSGQGWLKDANFLQAGYHIGLNTSQGAKRNGNLQFRSEPPNAKAVVSPWLNSDIEPDLLRKPLEVGEA
jgi:hypothetical protein